jgi:hypothetical protein
LKAAMILSLSFVIFISCNNDSSDERFSEDFNSDENDVSHFIFVGIAGETPSLYSFDFSSLKHKKFWYKPRENVIDYSVSPDFQKAYFLTALSIEEGGSLPLIRKLKLYLADLRTSEVKHIKNFGNVGQIITTWEDENTYRIILNTFDIFIATELNQVKQLYNGFGKLLIDESKTFDILKDGFPATYRMKKKYESPSGRFVIKEDPDRQFFLLDDKTTKQVDTLGTDSMFINDFWFSPNDRYVVANFVSGEINPLINNVDSSLTLIYSLSNKKNIRVWTQKGKSNFMLINRYLVFEKGSGTESKILIYDIKEDKVIHSINIRGGCGLKNIPGVVVYDVVD